MEQSIEDDIVASDDADAIPEWQRVLVRQRIAEYEANPEQTIPWEQVRAELQEKYGFGRETDGDSTAND